MTAIIEHGLGISSANAEAKKKASDFFFGWVHRNGVSLLSLHIALV